jgi:PAS domain-containing protein
VAYISIQQDITARFAAERERSLLAEALNAATDPVIVMDKDFVIVFANNAFGREVGRPVQTFSGAQRFN